MLKYLQLNGIQAGIHYPIPIHFQPAYNGRIRTAKNISVTEKLSEQVLSLPIYPELEYKDIDKIINTIKSFTSVN